MSTIQESAAETQAATVDAPPKKAMGLGRTASWVMLIILLILPLFVRNFVIFQVTMLLIYGIAVLALNILTGGSGQFSLGQSAFYALGG
jgi:branched-chain amino acid transport system permease protein